MKTSDKIITAAVVLFLVMVVVNAILAMREYRSTRPVCQAFVDNYSADSIRVVNVVNALSDRCDLYNRKYFPGDDQSGAETIALSGKMNSERLRISADTLYVDAANQPFFCHICSVTSTVVNSRHSDDGTR